MSYLILQIITIAQMMSTGGEREGVTQMGYHVTGYEVLCQQRNVTRVVFNQSIRKGKGKKSIYIAPFTVIHSKRSDVDHTVLPANNTMPAFPS